MTEGAKSAVGVDVCRPANAVGGSWTFVEQNLDQAEWPKLPAASFDLILAFDILEHVQSPWLFLEACHQRLAVGGTLVITTPNTSSWERRLRPNTWSGARDPQHKHLFNRYSLIFLLRQLRFKEVSLIAPIRKLGILASVAPQWGGQLCAVCS